MNEKTHGTAVVLIPPEECWEPIQKIRRLHDRKLRTWMPHMTLLYPFRPRRNFDEVAPRLAEACAQMAPFQLTLAVFHHFHHRGPNYTIWLLPEPADALAHLQHTLQRVVPDCNDVTHHARGFTPHLSVAQAHGYETMKALKLTFQAFWQPLTFTARDVSLIWREHAPHDAFQVDRTIPFGRDTSGSTSEAAL